MKMYVVFVSFIIVGSLNRVDAFCFNCADCFGFLFCTECKAGYYGDSSDCLDRCSTGCLDIVCQRSTGVCDCKPNYIGDRCEIPCPEHCTKCESLETCAQCEVGYHGVVCSNQCAYNCKNASCSKETGTCDYCIAGTHGDHCQVNCSENCGPDGCDQQTGHCNGCISGYSGTVCDEPCPVGCKVGSACSQTIGQCISGCKDGLTGTVCNSQCSTYCKQCKQFNPNDCDSCVNSRYGYYNETLTCASKCDEHCKDGFCDDYSGLCRKGCESTYWGLLCSDKCSPKCNGGNCYQTNGTCDSGCIIGYSGDQCVCQTVCKTCAVEEGVCILCETGFYLTDTSSCVECPLNCNNNTCGSYGECSYGCTAGFYGPTCTEPCDKQCVNNICYRPNGVCLHGCETGFHMTGLVCKRDMIEDTSAALFGVIGGAAGIVAVLMTAVCVLVVCLVRIRKRLHHNTEAASTEINDYSDLQSTGIQMEEVPYDEISREEIYQNEEIHSSSVST